jgi:hypothetical protein
MPLLPIDPDEAFAELLLRHSNVKGEYPAMKAIFMSGWIAGAYAATYAITDSGDGLEKFRDKLIAMRNTAS